jgi:hypothetical protein
MKNFLKKLVVTLCLAFSCAAFLLPSAAFADEVEEAPARTGVSETASPLDKLRSIGENTHLPAFDNARVHPDAPPDYLQEGVATFTSPVLYLIDFMRLLVSGIALVVVIYAAVKLTLNPAEDEAENAKKTLIWGVVGLVLIQLADTFVKRMFFGETGEAFEDIATATDFAQQSVGQIRGIIGFINIAIGTIAVAVIIIRGFTLIASMGSEDGLTKVKNQILYAVFGLVVVGLSEIIVIGFVFPENGEALPNINVGRKILVDLTNFASGFIALFAFVTLLYSGYRYVVSVGNDEVKEKFKKTAFSAVVAIILALGAFALVNTLVKYEEQPLNPDGENQTFLETIPSENNEN